MGTDDNDCPAIAMGELDPQAPNTKRLGVAGKIDLSKALRLYLSGVSQVDIGKVFGVSRQAISSSLKPFKIKHPEAVAAYEENHGKLISEKEMMALAALDGSKLKKASARDIATVYGILFDKRRLAEDKSTSNVNVFSRLIVEADDDL